MRGYPCNQGETEKKLIDLTEIEKVLEDKYQSMKYVKGWEEEEDDYVMFASPTKKKGHKK